MILAFLYFSTPVYAAVYHFYDGNKLLEAALEWEKSLSSSKGVDLLLVAGYAGYVGAMFDHLSEKQHICATDEMTKNEVLQTVADHVKSRNKKLDLTGTTIVEEALYKKYICR